MFSEYASNLQKTNPHTYIIIKHRERKIDEYLELSSFLPIFAGDKPIVELKSNTMKRKKFCVEIGVYHPILVWGKNLYFCLSTKINTKKNCVIRINVLTLQNERLWEGFWN